MAVTKVTWYTLTVTMLEGSSRTNVLPSEAIAQIEKATTTRKMISLEDAIAAGAK